MGYCFLGKCLDNCENMVKIKDNIYQTFHAGCTHAYIISLKCAKTLMKRLLYTASDTHLIGKEFCFFLYNFFNSDSMLHYLIKAYTFHPSIFVQDIVKWGSNLRTFNKSKNNVIECKL